MSDVISAVKRLEMRVDRRMSMPSGEPQDGWLRAGANTWTYASATTFTVTGDVTGRYEPGMFVKWTQDSTVKFGCIVSASYSSPNTTVTISGDAITNEEISDAFLSRMLTPYGANLEDFDADQFGSGGAGNGQMLRADGAGGAEWSANAQIYTDAGGGSTTSTSYTATDIAVTVAVEDGEIRNVLIAASGAACSNKATVMNVYFELYNGSSSPTEVFVNVHESNDYFYAWAINYAVQIIDTTTFTIRVKKGWSDGATISYNGRISAIACL